MVHCGGLLQEMGLVEIPTAMRQIFLEAPSFEEITESIGRVAAAKPSCTTKFFISAAAELHGSISR